MRRGKVGMGESGLAAEAKESAPENACREEAIRAIAAIRRQKHDLNAEVCIFVLTSHWPRLFNRIGHCYLEVNWLWRRGVHISCTIGTQSLPEGGLAHPAQPKRSRCLLGFLGRRRAPEVRCRCGASNRGTCRALTADGSSRRGRAGGPIASQTAGHRGWDILPPASRPDRCRGRAFRCTTSCRRAARVCREKPRAGHR